MSDYSETKYVEPNITDIQSNDVFISCLKWVKRGVAKGVPDKIQLNNDELRKIIQESHISAEDEEDSILSADEGVSRLSGDDDTNRPTPLNIKKKKCKKKASHKLSCSDKDAGDIAERYGLQNYDDASCRSGTSKLSNFASLEADTRMKKDDSDDDDDMVIKDTDNLLVVGKMTDWMSVLEVHVYNSELGNFYIHHDYLLPALPLVVEWLDFDGYDQSPGNLVAIGTMEPTIDIWDLDVVECLEPAFSLRHSTKLKKVKKKQHIDGHSDAVTDLSWNSISRHVLASASADHTVALWDLTDGKLATVLEKHGDVVQSCKWHPREKQTLLTGSADCMAAVWDCRNVEACYKMWKLDSGVTTVAWNEHNPLHFLVGTDSGYVHCIDVRHQEPVFSVRADEKAITGISLSSEIPGLVVTTSEGKCMKVWDLADPEPTNVLSHSLKMDGVFCVDCCPNAPFVFAFGGRSRESLKVWDIRQSAAVRSHFLKRMPIRLAQQCENDRTDVITRDDEEGASDTMATQTAVDCDEDRSESMTAEAVGMKKRRKRTKKRFTKGCA